MPGYDEIADIDVINGNMDKIDVQMKKNADSAQQSKDIVSDEYSATNTYAVGDYCIHENALYKCKTAITTGEVFDSNKWIQTTCGTEFRELNSNLGDYGLDNKFDGELLQGRYSTSDGNFMFNGDLTASKNKYKCEPNSNVYIMCENAEATQIYWYDGDSYISFTENTTGKGTSPSNATHFTFNVWKNGGMKVNEVGHICVYVDNAIEQIKNDLDTLSYGENSGGANLFDKSKIVRGAAIGSGGSPYSNGSYGYSGYIHVEPNTEYTFMNVDWFDYYDANKSHISQSTGGTGTTPSNAKYVIVSFILSVVNSVMVAKFHQTEYVPYVMSNKQLTSLKNDLGGLSFSVSGTTLSITDGTNTWTLSN